MLRHVVLARYNEDIPEERRAELVRALEALPAAVPSIRSYEVGAPLGLVPSPWELVVVALFDDRAGWQEYIDHPDHVAVRNLLNEIAPERTGVQLEV